MVKDDAPELLRDALPLAALAAARWSRSPATPTAISRSSAGSGSRAAASRCSSSSGTRSSAITKSALVARDADLYAALAAHGAAQVLVLGHDARRRARAPARAARRDARSGASKRCATLAAAGVPVGVMIGAGHPGPERQRDPAHPRGRGGRRRARRRAGCCSASRSRSTRSSTDWLAEHYPDRQARVLHRIRETRDGRISDSHVRAPHARHRAYAEQIAALFAVAARKHGLDRPLPPLSAAAFRRPPAVGDQLRLL